MRAKWLWTAVVLAAVTGCGEGRAILNVDIYSFLTGTGGDTLRLTPDPLPPMPPGTSVTDSITPVGVNLPGGLGSSLVDTVRVTGNIDVTNPTSSGSLSYAIFLASDPSPAVVYGGAPALTIGPASFPAATTGVPINAPNLAASARDLFKGSGLYIGVRASVSNTGAAGLKTTLKLTQLQARIVVQDKIF
ncbi:MAG TPA: hypothetical protein VN953_00510 [Gemmatimonadales bacterium]|nr:hypothetical protein [Gemmatimonadales bacterium]